MVAEETGYLIPGGNQVTTIAACDVDGRPEHIRDRRPGLLQGDPQVLQSLAHLRADITRGDHLPLLIERAGARCEDKNTPGSLGSVGVRGTREEPGAADEVHGHAMESARIPLPPRRGDPGRREPDSARCSHGHCP